MPQSHTDWTVGMVNALPADGNRYEVIDGELLVTPAPSIVHQSAVGELFVMLQRYARVIGQAAFIAPLAVTFSQRREVQPDVFVLPRLPDRRMERFSDVGVLTLAVEVLSPSTRRADKVLKRALFRDERVPEYWIVDPIARNIERWRLDRDVPETLTAEIVWHPDSAHAPMTIDVVQYFECVYDF